MAGGAREGEAGAGAAAGLDAAPDGLERLRTEELPELAPGTMLAFEAAAAGMGVEVAALVAGFPEGARAAGAGGDRPPPPPPPPPPSAAAAAAMDLEGRMKNEAGAPAPAFGGDPAGDAAMDADASDTVVAGLAPEDVPKFLRGRRDHERRRQQSASACKRYRVRQREEKARLNSEVAELRERVVQLETERKSAVNVLSRLEDSMLTIYDDDSSAAQRKRAKTERVAKVGEILEEINRVKSEAAAKLDELRELPDGPQRQAVLGEIEVLLSNSKCMCQALQCAMTPLEWLADNPASSGVPTNSSMECLMWDKPEGLAILRDLNITPAQAKAVLDERKSALDALEPVYVERRAILEQSAENLSSISMPRASASSDEGLEKNLLQSAATLEKFHANVTHEMHIRLGCSFAIFCGSGEVNAAFDTVQRAKLFIYGFPRNMKGIEFGSGVLKFFAAQSPVAR